MTNQYIYSLSASFSAIDWKELWISGVEFARTKGLSFLGNALIAIAIFFAGRIAARLLVKLVRRILEKSKVSLSLQKFLCDLMYAGLYVLVVIAALGQLGVNTTGALAIMGAAGIAVGFALQSSLSNFASGVMIMLFRPYKIGDLIKLDSFVGVVEEIQIFNTILVTQTGKKIIFPNSKVTDNAIENISSRGQVRVDLTFGVRYQDNIDTAKSILIGLLEQDKRVLQTPEPTVAVAELADSSVNLICRPWVHPDDYWEIKFDLIERVKKAFDAKGIEFPFPQREVHMTK